MTLLLSMEPGALLAGLALAVAGLIASSFAMRHESESQPVRA